ncbi:MAG: bifunctional transaldolase/phosoglucose isomerase [Anaerolineales bacterium]|nr:bifunctional transaldolase/phosoglucose isomerase [Anaerolineales bacterium]
MKTTQALTELGQSIWLDYIRRDLIRSGDLETLIHEKNVRGVTSNPSIFEKAISGSDLYTDSLRRLSWAGYSPETAFDVLAVEDIRAAADVFMPLYEQTDGGDGYVSLEVNPRYARDIQHTLQEARRLWEVVNRPNLMVKIPATVEGLPAVEDAIAEGININVTLIFSLQRYSEVMEAYLRGLERRAEQGYSVHHVASVASFFVSRIDSAVDASLQEIVLAGGEHAERAQSLMGTAAVTSAKLAYAQFQAVFDSERFKRLQEIGARVQRPLWASTSTKNPDYPDTLYVDSLIGPRTVTTLPLETLDAFLDHGTAKQTLGEELSRMRMKHEALSYLGISLDTITDKLEQEGVDKFRKAFEKLLKSLEKGMKSLRSDISSTAEPLEQVEGELRQNQVGRRIWGRDVSLWTQDPEEIEEARNRLGWLTLPEQTGSELEEFQQLREQLLGEGYTKVLWLGMGGSSLAADVFSNVFPNGGGLQLRVLDSTDPAEVAKAAAWADPGVTLYVAASKSGSTAEPLAMMETFWEKAREGVGEGFEQHFAVVTDPGSSLEKLAKERSFRKVFSSPADVGGRYSALSAFGILPAVLLGVDAGAVLEGARSMAAQCNPNREPAINPGLSLGAFIAACVRSGRSVLSLPADPELKNIADWIEQLIAESSGKNGGGIIPIVGQKPDVGKGFADRQFVVYLRASGAYDRLQAGWRKAGVPFCALPVCVSAESLGSTFFLWEYATAAACALLGLNAFNQPDVQRAKKKTVEMLHQYQKMGRLSESEPLWQNEYLALSGPLVLENKKKPEVFSAAFEQIIQQAQESYLAILLFLPRSDSVTKPVLRAAARLRDKAGVPVSIGFGPRYLHSTGQLHKGGIPGTYLVLTGECEEAIAIPGAGYGFCIFEKAQALGDLQSLIEIERPVLWLHLKRPEALDWLEGKLRQLYP